MITKDSKSITTKETRRRLIFFDRVEIHQTREHYGTTSLFWMLRSPPPPFRFDLTSKTISARNLPRNLMYPNKRTRRRWAEIQRSCKTQRLPFYPYWRGSQVLGWWTTFRLLILMDWENSKKWALASFQRLSLPDQNEIRSHDICFGTILKLPWRE